MEKPYLTLTGKCAKSLSPPGMDLYFVDYAVTNFELHRLYTIKTINGVNTGIARVSIKITHCFDQQLNSLSEVPKGWKTACQIEFIGGMWMILSNPIDKLPEVAGWEYNPEAVKLVFQD